MNDDRKQIKRTKLSRFVEIFETTAIFLPLSKIQRQAKKGDDTVIDCAAIKSKESAFTTNYYPRQQSRH